MAENIYLEVNGQAFTGWETIQVKKSLETLCGTFQFTTSTLKNNVFPIRVGDSCKVLIENVSVLNGWIEKLTTNLDANAYSITISGRDRTNDLLDSQVGANISFTPPVKLKQIAEKLLADLNLSDIKVIDRLNLPALTELPIKTAGLSSNNFDFLQKYAQQQAVLLTTNGDGNLAFERAGTDKLNTVLSTNKEAVGTILTSQIAIDYTKRFNHYIIASQAGVGSPFQSISQTPQQKANIQAQTTDSEIRDSRIFYFQSPDPSNQSIAQKTVDWQANFRRSQSVIYTCEVQGFIPIQDITTIWKPNQLVRIIDNFAQVDATMLIANVTYTQDLSAGSKTKLELFYRRSFTLEVNKPAKAKKAAKIANPWLVDNTPTTTTTT